MTDPQRERALEVASGVTNPCDDHRCKLTPTPGYQRFKCKTCLLVDRVADLLLEFAREARLDEAKQSPHEWVCAILQRGEECDCARGERIAQLQDIK